MKKHLYLLLPLLTLAPTLTTQNEASFFSRILVGIGLSVLINNKANHDGRKKRPLELYNLDEKQILDLILSNYLRKAKIKKHLPNELKGLIHTFFIHEWTIYGFHKDTGTTYDPHDFDISGIHKETQTHLNPRGFTQNGDYKDLDPTTNKPTKYDPQGYNIDRWNKDGLHQNGTKLNNQGFAQHVNHASIHLHTAIHNLDKRTLTLLLKNPNINVNLQQKYDWPPLIMCCWKGDDALPIAQALLKHQHININLQNNDGWTPLMMCCYEGQKSLHIAQALLKRKDINVNLQDNDGWTPLDIMIYWIKRNDKNYKYVQLWNLLVAQGAVLNTHKNDYYSLNPNHFQEPQKTYVHIIKQNPPKITPKINNKTNTMNTLPPQSTSPPIHHFYTNRHFNAPPTLVIVQPLLHKCSLHRTLCIPEPFISIKNLLLSTQTPIFILHQKTS